MFRPSKSTLRFGAVRFWCMAPYLKIVEAYLSPPSATVVAKLMIAHIRCSLLSFYSAIQTQDVLQLKLWDAL